MIYKGTVQGNHIKIDEVLPFADGTRVSVDVAAEGKARKGSPAVVLRLAGTLTPEESDAILRAAQECRRIDEALWASGQ